MIMIEPAQKVPKTIKLKTHILFDYCHLVSPTPNVLWPWPMLSLSSPFIVFSFASLAAMNAFQILDLMSSWKSRQPGRAHCYLLW